MECGEWEERDGGTYLDEDESDHHSTGVGGSGLFGLGAFGYILISRAASAGRRDGRVQVDVAY